ncbi:MAG: 4-(cytidine 5'-diphospho)-2-C-methyl-D-erythritol kinase [Myxococcota bacterium]|nr:4-(cytidine 5'-diphospho)-2-C-methyl-D-erythritol kinase [Myxococcota bacterium]
MNARADFTRVSGRLEMAAPAKLNLGLKVVGRRADGYHLIESLFVPLDLADALSVEVAPADRPTVRLKSSVADDALGVPAKLPSGPENLAHRAAEGFLREAGLSWSVSLELLKRIPVAAGLGGGSSDAGAVLRALDALAPGALGRRRLAALGLSLGADVPFFLSPRPALVEGVGERVTPVGGLPRLCLVLANPGQGLSTARVFEAFGSRRDALTRAGSGSTLRSLSDWLAQDPGDSEGCARRLAELLENDLADAARRLCPEIGQIQARLVEMGAQAVGMSGSGATSFGVFANPSEAKSAIRNMTLRGDGWARLAGTWPAR